MRAVRRRATERRVKCHEFSLDPHSKVSSPCSDSVKSGEFQQPANLTVSLLAPTSAAARTAMKPAGDGLCDEQAQGWNRVGHMPLCPSGGREGRNPGVRKAFVVERSFFWSRHG